MCTWCVVLHVRQQSRTGATGIEAHLRCFSSHAQWRGAYRDSPSTAQLNGVECCINPGAHVYLIDSVCNYPRIS